MCGGWAGTFTLYLGCSLAQQPSVFFLPFLLLYKDQGLPGSPPLIASSLLSCTVLPRGSQCHPRLTCLMPELGFLPSDPQITSEPSWVVHHEAPHPAGLSEGMGMQRQALLSSPFSVSSPPVDSGSCTSDEGHHSDLSGYEVTYTFNKLQLCK